MSQPEFDPQPEINTQPAGAGQPPRSISSESTPKQSKAWIVGALFGLLVFAVLVWVFVFKEDDAKPAASGGCKDGEEKVGTKCLVQCTDGQDRVGDKCLVKCEDGKIRVGDKCGFLLTKNGNRYTRTGYDLYKCTSGWCNNRWMLDGGLIYKLYSNPVDAATPGDVTDWRTTSTDDIHGDRLVNDFQLYNQDGNYYLPGDIDAVLGKAKIELAK